MGGFKQTNPDDNPVDENGKTARDRELDAQNKRPYGETGVDKPHGGGSTGLENMGASGHARDTGTPSPRPNPNNPDDPTNPTFKRPQLATDGEQRRAAYGDDPVQPGQKAEGVKRDTESELKEAEAERKKDTDPKEG